MYRERVVCYYMRCTFIQTAPQVKVSKLELKAWHRLKANDNTITTLQTEFDLVFHQSDQYLENLLLYDTMYYLGQRLNYQIFKHHEFFRQHSKVLWLRETETLNNFMPECQ